jgi:hypothetical protein
MKPALLKLSECYVRALRKRLKGGPRPGFQPAWRPGRQAVALGLELLGLARIHERAVVVLELARGRASVTRRAEVFRAQAITPLVEACRAARQSKAALTRLNATLGRRTLAPFNSNDRLPQGGARRKGDSANPAKEIASTRKLVTDSIHSINRFAHELDLRFQV